MKRLLLLSLALGLFSSLLHAQEDKTEQENVKVYEFEIEEETDGNTHKDHKVFVRRLPANGEAAGGDYKQKKVVIIEEDANNNGDRVKLELIENENGTTYRKYVNGEEVEVTEADKERMNSRAPANPKGLLNMYGIDEIECEVLGNEQEIRVMGDSIHRVIVRSLKGLPEDLENLEYDMDEIREHLKHLQVEMEELHPEMIQDTFDALERTPKKGKLSVYPNPTDGEFRLEYQLKERVAASYRVVDSSGKTILEKDLGKVEGSVNETVDLTGRTPGIYIIEFQAGDELEKSKIMID